MDATFNLILISETPSTSNIGEAIVIETPRTVHAYRTSVYMSLEAYAEQRGRRADIRCTTSEYNYNGERLAEIDGVRYEVIKEDYGKGDVALVLERKGGVERVKE